MKQMRGRSKPVRSRRYWWSAPSFDDGSSEAPPNARIRGPGAFNREPRSLAQDRLDEERRFGPERALERLGQERRAAVRDRPGDDLAGARLRSGAADRDVVARAIEGAPELQPERAVLVEHARGPRPRGRLAAAVRRELGRGRRADEDRDPDAVHRPMTAGQLDAAGRGGPARLGPAVPGRGA